VAKGSVSAVGRRDYLRLLIYKMIDSSCWSLSTPEKLGMPMPVRPKPVTTFAEGSRIDSRM
jgi:hypothetical protein